MPTPTSAIPIVRRARRTGRLVRPMARTDGFSVAGNERGGRQGDLREPQRHSRELSHTGEGPTPCGVHCLPCKYESSDQGHEQGQHQPRSPALAVLSPEQDLYDRLPP
jgi:hypothetical protein